MNIRQLMQQSGVAFGTSGARGLVSQMTDEVCQAYTAAFLQVASKTFSFQRVALGIDLRPSSPAVARACADAIQAAGYTVEYCGVLPTPALAFYSLQMRLPAIMVTGSHIPFDRNGLKFYRPDGEITKNDETAIGDVVLDTNRPASGKPLPSVNSAALSAYAQRYRDFFSGQPYTGMRLGLYEHSSAARDVFRQLLEALGAEVISLGRTDTFVPIDTEAVSAEDAQRGRQWATEYRLDAILSTDGDGDRPLIGDETGRWLRGDIVGLLCGRYLGVRALAVPVSCNTAIELSGAFATVIRTRIGSPYVIAGMEELRTTGLPVAGFEANGGFLLGSRIEREGRKLAALPTRDAVLPALALLAAVREASTSLSRLVAALPPRFTASDRLQNFPTEQSQCLIAQWGKQPAELLDLLNWDEQVRAVDVTDGLRLNLGSGDIVHLRPSGNAPELRCYCEAATQEQAEALVEKVLGQLILLRIESV